MVELAATSLGSIDSRYRPLLELGRGGTARIFLAKSRQSGLRKLVVLKTLEPELAMNVEMRDLFRREAEVCARLNHPNIVQVHEVVEEATGPIIVMEYLEGVALSQAIMRSEGRFSRRLYLHAITQLLAGLHYFHELRDYDRRTALNAVHRDVSPQNVILLYEGAVKVLDFGIAKLATETQTTQTGVVKGKLHYMPAEQLLSDVSIDRRADIFSAGVMLWEALAGRRMWHGCAENTVMRALVTGNLPSLHELAPDYPNHFYEIVSRATAFEPSKRYPTALELQLDVEHILEDLGGPVHPRELSDFMRTEFGEHRHQREVAIEAAMHQSIPPLVALGLAEENLTRQAQPFLSGAGRSEVITTPTRRKRSRLILFTTVSLLFIGIGAGLIASRRSASPPQFSATAKSPITESSAVHFAISSIPVGALVLLDGTPLGNTPLALKLPARKSGTLEIKAEKYESATRTISLSEDVSMEIQLQPIVATASAAADTLRTKKSSKHLAVAPSTAKPKPASAPDCSPPYSLSSDGIRTYKAECFGDTTGH